MNPTRLLRGLPLYCRTCVLFQSRFSSGKSEGSRPAKYVTKPTLLSVTDSGVARQVVEIVGKKAFDDPLPLLITSPGSPVIVDEFLVAGVKDLYVYESRMRYRRPVKDALQKHKLEHRLYFSTVYQLFQEEIFAAMDRPLPFHAAREWNEIGPSFRIFGAHSDFLYCLKLMLKMCLVTERYNLGRPEMIICVPEKCWTAASTLNKYSGLNPAGVLYPVGYNVELLGYVPRQAFFPKNRIPQKKIKREDEGKVVVLSVTPVRHLFKLIRSEDLTKLQFITQQYMVGFAKMKYVIPELEKWIPGCGQDLVLAGIDVTDTFWNLSCDNFLTMFNTFVSHPDFKSSTFITDMSENVWGELKFKSED